MLSALLLALLFALLCVLCFALLGHVALRTRYSAVPRFALLSAASLCCLALCCCLALLVVSLLSRSYAVMLRTTRYTHTLSWFPFFTPRFRRAVNRTYLVVLLCTTNSITIIRININSNSNSNNSKTYHETFHIEGCDIRTLSRNLVFDVITSMNTHSKHTTHTNVRSLAKPSQIQTYPGHILHQWVVTRHQVPST